MQRGREYFQKFPPFQPTPVLPPETGISDADDTVIGDTTRRSFGKQFRSSKRKN